MHSIKGNRQPTTGTRQSDSSHSRASKARTVQTGILSCQTPLLLYR